MSSKVSSSRPAAQTGGTATGAPTKKKFGKNLNKLVPASAPPIASSSQSKQAHDHGLLLLSTKRGSATGLLRGSMTKPATPGGTPGEATAAAAASATPGAENAAQSSTNAPAAGTGSTDTGTDTATTPSSKPAPETPAPRRSLAAYEPSPVSTHDVLLSAVALAAAQTAGSDQPAAAPDAWGVAEQNKPSPKESDLAEEKAPPAPQPEPVVAETPQHRDPSHWQQQQDLEEEERFLGPRVVLETNWDEYGGRDTSGVALQQQQQQQLQQQPKQLLTGPPPSQQDNKSGEPSAADNLQDEDDPQAAYMSRLAKDRAIQRKAEEEARFQEQRERAQQRLRELESRNPPANSNKQHDQSWDRTRSGTRGLWEPKQQLQEPPQPHEQQPSSAEVSPMVSHQRPVIQLNSYDDRSRGEAPRDTAAAPRMLYDPKSGSMVAVKSRDSSGHQAESRKERKKGRQQQREEKQKKGKSRLNHDSKANAAPTVTIKKKAASVSTMERRLPRTCGVLYARDAKGNLSCVDACEGDLAYGAHSVPGGRLRNPEAYARFLEENQMHYNDKSQRTTPGYHGNDLNKAYGNQSQKSNGGGFEQAYDNGQHGQSGGVGLYTGFHPQTEEEPQPHQPEPVEWVKPTDKIELVTGVDDESPTLKPTAKEFAPSMAALAAAKAAASVATPNESLNASTDHSAAMEQDEDDDDPIRGLGFDPTQDMDFVMQSPVEDRSDKPSRLGSINLNALALDTPLTSEGTTNPRHIFAFGSSVTWGANQANVSSASSSDWNVPIVGNAGGLFGTEAFRGGDSGDQDPVDSASFLNTINSSSSWGAIPSTSSTNNNNLASTSSPNLEGLLSNGADATTTNAAGGG